MFFYSFDGTNFITEASSQFPHREVWALGNYRNSPFVTGENSSTGLKTEILDYEAGEWNQEEDYPFAGNGTRYVYRLKTSLINNESLFMVYNLYRVVHALWFEMVVG